MPTNTYVALDKVTVGTATASVTFSSISSAYTDLRIVLNVTASSLVNGRMQFNGDTSALYSTTVLYGSGSVAASTRQSGQNSIWLDNTDTGTNWCVTTIDVMNYSNSTTFKTALIRGNAASSQVDAHVGLWRNTNAITSLTLFPSSGTYSVGSTFSLYGIAAEGAAYATGGMVTSDANYYYHTFLASGTFTPLQSLTCDVLVVAGGGGGGSNMGGGGGAGGLLAFTSQSISTAQTVTIGGGGAGDAATGAKGINGTNSIFGGLTTAIGGGGGGTLQSVGGSLGGSGGGGASGYLTGTGGTGGAATSGQGFAGGSGASGAVNAFLPGGGGGGAGVVGGNGTGFAGSSISGFGGNGISTYSSWGSATTTGQNVSGTYWYSGGGSGGNNGVSGAVTGAAGNGGGGKGGGLTSVASGTANTGGGGGGGGNGGPSALDGAAGGSGIVIVRYAK
jgi:hypothetical protein